MIKMLSTSKCLQIKLNMTNQASLHLKTPSHLSFYLQQKDFPGKKNHPQMSNSLT